MIVTTLLKFAAPKLISGFMFFQMCQPGLPPVTTSGGSNEAPPKAGWRFKDNAQQWTPASTIKVVLCNVGPACLGKEQLSLRFDPFFTPIESGTNRFHSGAGA
jgi:hypothetical protein